MVALDPAMRSLLDALPEPALIITGGVVRLVNPAAQAVLGRNLEGGNIRLAIRHPQALEFVLAGLPGDVDVNGIGDIGHPWRLTLRPLDERNYLLRLVDRSAAEAAEKLRVDFVANASHELRTPLTTVIGYAESLEEGHLDGNIVASFAGTIRAEARRMLRIIEDLMSLSRIEADRFVAPTGTVVVADVVRSAVENIRRLADRRACHVAVEIQDGLPPIRGDYAQLLQVADNLLNNALRYGCSAEACSICISAVRDGSFIRLTVIDTGPGIPRQHLPFVTRRFYRVDEARSRDSGGTGLGLALVKHIVERHRGTLSIESQIGKGTTVSVKLPIDE